MDLKDPRKQKGVSKSVLPGHLEIDLVEGAKRTDKKNFELLYYLIV